MYGAWDYTGCTLTPACTITNGSESGSCPAGYSGSSSRSTSYNACTGLTTYGLWDSSGCVASPTCSGGRTWDGSSCVCPAGAWNGSTCVLSYSWVLTADWYQYDASYTQSIRQWIDCPGRSYVFSWGDGDPTMGSRFQALFLPGGKCFCDGLNPPNKDLSYRDYGVGGESAWDYTYTCQGR